MDDENDPFKKILCVGAINNTFDSDKIGFQLRVRHHTWFHVEHLESCFDAGQIELFPVVLMHCTCTCVPEASKQRLLCCSMSVKKKQRDCSDGVNLATLC